MITRKNERAAALEVVFSPEVRHRGPVVAGMPEVLVHIPTNGGLPAPSVVRPSVVCRRGGALTVGMWRDDSAAASGRLSWVPGSAR